MSLKAYHKKRNFKRTAEPKGSTHSAPKQKALSFVIQKHDASRLHYDFRLEAGGVLKSWAVPKGIPLRKGDKRLAMHVEDHPLEYGGFEGTIPEGNYGAGTVMLWDRGHYELLGGEPERAVEEGKLHFRLDGKKLHGEWTLVRMRGRNQNDKDAWLLLKSGEDAKAISARKDDESVLSGKTMKQIAGGKARVWNSNRSSSAKAPATGSASRSKKKSTQNEADPDADLKQFPIARPAFVSPMKARLVDKPPASGEWTFEIKWDGYRAVAVKKDDQVRLFSRSERDITPDFPEVAEAVRDLPPKNLVADGEIVALDANGRPSFQLLQNYRQRGSGKQNICYYLFDLLNLENHDLKKLPLETRKDLLQRLIAESGDPIRFSAGLKGDPETLLQHAKQKQLEGLIAKEKESVYEAGRRSGAWLKIKCVNEQEFVIGGFTAPQGSRKYFGAILVGYYEGKQLIFCSKVGTGFDTETLRALHGRFAKLKTDHCPFSNLPARGGRGATHGLSPAETRRAAWISPELVCQVRFTEWTDDGGLRHPVYLGLRDDKKPREVVREKEA